MDKIITSILIAIYYVMDIAQFLFIIRAILSWFPNTNNSKLSEFLYEMTEPFIRPVRKLLNKTQLANSMLDFSFLITFMVLILVQDIAWSLQYAI